MVPAPIPEQVMKFIDERIDSVPQLETLLAMREDPHRAWNASDVAARVYVSVAEGARILEALHRRGLLAPGEPGGALRFSLADESERPLIDDVVEAYRANLMRITTFIHEKPPASLKEFARAFDLKKDR